MSETELNFNRLDIKEFRDYVFKITGNPDQLQMFLGRFLSNIQYPTQTGEVDSILASVSGSQFTFKGVYRVYLVLKDKLPAGLEVSVNWSGNRSILNEYGPQLKDAVEKLV